MIRLRDRMTPISKLRYMAWRAGLIGDSVDVTFSTGEQLLLRKSMMMGLGVAYEIFVMDVYRCPRELKPESVRHIVDIGANLGYSLIYWAAKFPQAQIDAFEPHPRHLDVLRRSLQMNRIEERVNVHPMAVGDTAGTFELIDAGAASTIAKINPGFDGGAFRRIKVEVVDFFAAIDGKEIDLLKLDCEGAEYGILMDPHFEALKIRNLVMEWHATEEHPEACRELTERLRDLKWEVQAGAIENAATQDGIGQLRAGILWGFHP